MTHLHEMHDTDTHFKIDPITRQIINKSEKTKLIQGDHNSEIYTFDIPAIIEGHKMIDCNRIEVHFTNKPRKGSDISEDVYVVNDAKTVDYNLVFSWEVGRKATKYAGGLSFLIKFLCIEEDGAITYEWNTETFDGIEVAAGKNNTEQIVEESYDILNQFGKVKTVNGVEPDENGNVEIDIDIPEIDIPECEVKTVNGVKPDENGNITIEFPEVEIPDCVVQTVNGVEPDENGNIQIDIPEIPEIDIPECAVQTVNGKAPDENGNIEIDIPEPTNPLTIEEIDAICGVDDVTALVNGEFLLEATDSEGNIYTDGENNSYVF